MRLFMHFELRHRLKAYFVVSARARARVCCTLLPVTSLAPITVYTSRINKRLRVIKPVNYERFRIIDSSEEKAVSYTFKCRVRFYQLRVVSANLAVSRHFVYFFFTFRHIVVYQNLSYF